MGKKILVVDDEEDVREIIKARLIAQGYDVLTAEEGMSALAIARREKPDLVILDVMMPNMDGYTTLRELRKDREVGKTPVIILSVKEKDKMEDIFYFQNISDYIEKPFESEELIRKVKQVLGER
ncbi:MAG: response regulator [Candidatus Omnitrophica bacterium]|nr:response regulator [Candidatus Omnitrophota bacterium]MCM8798059.1 response regulator [Candidatus Omnitrophota bacterium]